MLIYNCQAKFYFSLEKYPLRYIFNASLFIFYTYHNMFSSKKKGFTLIEMLIVIVIIGILAAALVPRMMSARDKAADTAIQSDIQQVASAITQYGFDFDPATTLATFTSGMALSGKLVPNYLSSMPASANKMSFKQISRGGTTSGGFVLYAPVATPGAANWVLSATTITSTSSAQTLIPCTTPVKVVAPATAYNGGTGYCTYLNDTDLYRIYVY